METAIKFLASYGIICLIIFIFAMYFSIRSFKVVNFRKRLFDIMNKAHGTRMYYTNKALAESIEKKIIGGSSLRRMTFSFKPLKTKFWFTDEEVSLIEALKQK